MDIKLPNLGEGADSGTVVSVFVKEGDMIAKDQPVLELENEKAVATIPSTLAGKVSKVHIKSGDKISVGQRLISLADPGSGTSQKSSAAPESKSKAAPAAGEKSPPEPNEEKEQEDQAPEADARQFEEPALTPPAGAAGIPAPASPSLRRTARELGLDLARVRGSGRGGRILLEDVRAYIQRLQRLASEPRSAARASSAQGSQAPTPKPPAESIDFSKWGPITKQPLTPLRQVIARRMSENWNVVPHVTQFANADVTQLNALRKKHAPAYEAKGAKLTLTCFVIKAVVDTLKQHPVFNSSLDEAAQEIILKQYFNIGIAVDTEAGLIVPVLRNADKKSLIEIAKVLEELAARARDRKVSGEDLRGGTFTISNQGGIGGAHFTPIVNKPEVAILGLGRAAMQPVVRDNKTEPRLVLPIGLSYDHRVIDGGIAARFAVDLVAAFEQFREEDAAL